MQPNTLPANILPPVNRLRTTLGQHREADPRKQVVERRFGSEKGTEPPISLTEGERGELEECEKTIERGLGTFYEVGNALLTIRESCLYRITHTTFEQYCQERWDIGRSYAWRVMGASERLKLLPADDTLPRPANECQMRPFLKLAPGEFPGAWKRAVKTAKEGHVTASIVQAVIRELLLPNGQDQLRAGKKKRTGKSKAKLPAGQFLALLNEAKRQVEKGETDKALATLERIESLLFGAEAT
jgi:hypothetical protein